jgi:hypothetical protein
MKILTTIYVFILTLFTSYLNAQIEINQLIYDENDSTFVRIFYNEIPDSLKMNDELIFIDNGQMMKLKPGIYTFEAFKECYNPTIKKVTLVSKRVKPVTLKMIHFSSSEKLSYDVSLYSNIVALPILNTLMIANKNNKEYVLPVATTSIVQAYWHWQQSDKFEPCSQKYLGQKTNKNDLNINLGISTQNVGYFKPSKSEVSYVRSSITSTFTHRFNQEINLSLNSASFIPNFALFFEMRKYFISSKIFAELFLHSFLSSKIKLDLKESYIEQWRKDFARDWQGEFLRKYPILVEATANIEFLSVLDQTFFFSLGGYWGNPFIPKDNFFAPVQQPYLPPQVYENPEEIKYSQNSYGIKMGLSWETPLNESFKYNVGLKWYSESSWGFMMLTSSFKYRLW